MGPVPTGTLRHRVGYLLIAGALFASFIAGVDPTTPAAGWLGVVGSLAGMWLLSISARRRRAPLARYLAGWALLISVTAPVAPTYRADWMGYVGHLRSFTFDRDLDFQNEWESLGAPTDRRTATGLLENSTPVGPAVLWSPFYGAAHVYVSTSRRLGRMHFEADGLSAPYLRSTRIGTLTGVYLGGIALIRALQTSFGLAISMLSVLASVLSSTVIYYSVFLGAMAHGLAFGVAAAFVAQWLVTRREPSLGRWLALGLLLGALASCRWQAVVYGLMLLPLAWIQWRRGSARPHWFGLAALGMLVMMLPQFLAWEVLYGAYVTIPQGRGFMNWSSPNFWNTLISADRGLFNWTPVMLLGFVGLVSVARRDLVLGLSGLTVFFATAWVNGSVPGHDWQGGDAFGARRFTLVVPLLSLGLAALVQSLSDILRRAPLLAVGAGLAIASLWKPGARAPVQPRHDSRRGTHRREKSRSDPRRPGRGISRGGLAHRRCRTSDRLRDFFRRVFLWGAQSQRDDPTVLGGGALPARWLGGPEPPTGQQNISPRLVSTSVLESAAGGALRSPDRG